MERVNLTDLEEGQTILIGEIGVGEFGVAKVEYNRVEFEDWDKINMDKGIISHEGKGEISHKEGKGVAYVLDKKEIKEVEKIKNKIKMLKELDN